MKTNLSKRQSEIINAAIRIIGEGGIQALTIKNLSTEIGIVESALYRHFKSRTEIIETLLDSIKEDVTSIYTGVSQSKKSSFARIKDLIDFQLDTFSTNPSFAIVILSDGLYKNEVNLRNKIYQGFS